MKIIKYFILFTIILIFTYFLGGTTYIRDIPLSDCPRLDMARADSNNLAHEYGGLEADISDYNGLVKVVAGVTGYVIIGGNGGGSIVIVDSPQVMSNKFYGGTGFTIVGDGSISDTLFVANQIVVLYLAVDTVNSNVEFEGYINIPTDSLKINGTNVTATAAELNNLDVAGSKGELEADKVVTLDASKKVNDWFVTDTLKVENNLQTPVLIYNMPTVGGTADSIDLDYTSNIHSIVTGMKVCFIADSSNTGNCTITIDGANEKSIIEASDLSNLEANDIRAKMIVELIYDGSKFQMISQSGN